MRPDPSARPGDGAADAASDFVRALVPQWAAHLGSELIGIYLIGSLAHGGFSARYSDIDVALITERGLAPEALEGLRAQAASHAPALAQKVSFFCTDRRFAVGRFPPLDRGDYLEHAVALFERERIEPARPTLTEVRDYLCGAPFMTWCQRAERFAGSEALDPSERKAYLRALLYPARFAYSFMTGRMASNDEAVAALDAYGVVGLDLDLIARALACRNAGADPDPLFSDRARLSGQVAACTRLVEHG